MSHTPRKQYVYSLDMVRALSILGVVLVHSVRFALVPHRPISGSLLQLIFQFGRVSFMIVTGFILAYQYRQKSPRWLEFFKRRAISAALPYVIWLVIFLSLSVPLWPVVPFVKQYLGVLFTGDGHLYYMVITFQMYLLTPVLLFVLKKGERYLKWLAVLAILWEMFSWTMAGYFHELSWAPPLFVTAYVGFFILGGIIGHHWPQIESWISSHRQYGLMVLLPATTLIVATFFIDNKYLGGLNTATNMFQPMTVIYTLAITFALLTAGTWFAETRGHHPHVARVIGVIADASFGIFLVHPLFVHGWLDLLKWQGISINPYLNTLFTWGVGVLMSIMVVTLIRMLPFSEYLIGIRRRTQKAPVAVSHPREVAGGAKG